MNAAMLLLPEDASTEGSRQLRALLRKHPITRLAKRVRCDPNTIRNWAEEKAKPCRRLSANASEALGIPEVAWYREPEEDAYDDVGTPPTARARRAGT